MTTYSGTMTQYMTQLRNAAEMEQATRTRLAASGYVETFPGMWERPSAAHELLSKDAPMKLTAWASMLEVER